MNIQTIVILIFKETLILIKIIFKLSLLIILNIIQEYKVAHNIIDLKKWNKEINKMKTLHFKLLILQKNKILCCEISKIINWKIII